LAHRSVGVRTNRLLWHLTCGRHKSRLEDLEELEVGSLGVWARIRGQVRQGRAVVHARDGSPESVDLSSGPGQGGKLRLLGIRAAWTLSLSQMKGGHLQASAGSEKFVIGINGPATTSRVHSIRLTGVR
jgi:hypothetical protein